MSRVVWIVLIALMPGVLIAQEEVPAKGAKTKGAKGAAPAITGMQDQASYAIGVDIGRRVAEADINAEMLIQGIRDVLAKKKLVLTDEEMDAAMRTFGEAAQAKAQAQAKELGEKNMKEGEKFLADNKKIEGVTISKTGLQYKVIKSGEGKSPKKSSTVKVHYHGTFIDGTVFDSSIERMEPLELSVDGVIPGWTEALLGMKVGDKWQLVIPSELAYGKTGKGIIPPNSVLVFEVELLEIVRP